MKDLIKKLVAVGSPSGYEGAIRDLIVQEIDSAADSVKVDPLGNLIVRKGHKKDGGLRILLSAHLDEVGLIATHVDKHGFVRFTGLGVIYARYCLGAHVRFLNGVQGIIGADVPEDPAKAFTIDQLFVDVGASNPADCPIKVGDPAVFERPVMELGSRFVSKALDDRISCAVLIEVLRKVNPGNNELVFVFSTQEEVGIRGVISAAYSVDPDLGIAVDVTSVGDTPKAKMEVALGKGPAIKIRDGGMIADPAVVRWMRRGAEAAGIDYQLEILDVLATTDARAIQVTRAGVPTGCISIPTRYIHSPAEMVDLNDVEKVKDLVLALLSQPIEIK